MNSPDCISCRTLSGAFRPPGGILYENDCWAFFLGSRPRLVAGQGFLVLKRHCENVADLTSAEQATLGSSMTRITAAFAPVLQPVKVHFGLYGEGVKHIHLHVTPRVTSLPAGNIPLIWMETWLDIRERFRLYQPIADSEVERVAARLKIIFEQMERPASG